MKIQFSKKEILLFISAVLLATLSMAQSIKPTTNYLGIEGSIIIDGQSFSLSWSAHPSPNFYKQEYLEKGSPVDKYKTMVLIDVVTGDQDIKAAVTAKINELKKMKASNPVINYDVIRNPSTGEYLVDFLLTANEVDGSVSIVEHNVYRYALFTDKNGNKGLLLFGISTRGYGTEVDNFLLQVKARRKTVISTIAKYPLPAISITQ